MARSAEPLSRPVFAAAGQSISFPPRRSGTLQKARVLVVDDVAENRELLCEVLRGAGFDASDEASGAACLEKARAGSRR